MAALSINISYCPVRIGFVVEEGNVEQLLKAAELSTMLWGGIYNPIIPASSDAKLASALVECFNLDALIPLSTDEGVKSFLESNKDLSWPGPLSGKFGSLVDLQQLVDVSHAIRTIYERGLRRGEKSNCYLPKWDPVDKYAKIFTVEFGLLTKLNDSKYDYADAYKKGLPAKIVNLVKDKPLPKDVYAYLTPILLTGHKLNVHSTNVAWQADGIYLGDSENFEDLAHFWNLRAAGEQLHFLPTDGHDRFWPAVEPFADEVVEHNRVNHPGMAALGVWHSDALSHEKIQKILKPVTGTSRYTIMPHLASASMWANARAGVPKTESQKVLANVDRPYEKLAVAFQLPKKDIVYTKRTGPQQLIGMSYNITGEFALEDTTLMVPPISKLNEWYSFEIAFAHWAFRAGRDDSRFIVGARDEDATLYPIGHKDLIRKILEEAQISSEPSAPGTLAEQLREQMGGLEDFRIFKVPGVRKLIAKKPDESSTYSTAKQIIDDEDPITHKKSIEDHEDLHIQAMERPKLTAGEIFDYLVRKNVLQVGLEPTCPNCGLTFWLPVRLADSTIPCGYCGKPFLLSLQLKSRGDWCFRRSGLFGKDNNQEGAIPVMLTLLQLSHATSLSKQITSTALKLKSKVHSIDCETDLAVLESHRDGTMDLLIGECKTGDSISEQDIKNLEGVKNAIESQNPKIVVHIIFSKLSDLTTEEIVAFKALKGRGTTPVIFTRRELEPYDMYDYYQKNKITLTKEYAFSFDDMAQNAGSIYLS